VTGIPTKFAIVDQALPLIGSVGSNEHRFVYLGAIGASLGDFLPSGVSGPRSPYLDVWSPVLRLFAGTTPTNGVAYCLNTLWTRLSRLRQVIDDKDKLELFGMIDELRELDAIGKSLSAAVAQIPGMQAEVFESIKRAEPFPSSRPKVPPSNAWHVRGTLHGSHPGRFLRALRERATASTASAKAFAVGAGIGYASDLCGNPYINSVVNAPHRSHWWRHRWISNNIDTWVWGYYRANASMSGVTPNPPYPDWPNLREANLQDRLEFGLDPAAVLGGVRAGGPFGFPLPQEIVDVWLAAYRDTYGAPPPGVDSAGLQGAASLAWLVLWLQTSGQAIPCVPLGRIRHPEASTRPSWMDSVGQVDVDGQIIQPPMPSRDPDPDEAELVSALIAAVVAAFNFYAGVVVTGIDWLVTAIVLAVDAVTDPKWDELSVHIGWVLVYLSGEIKELHDLMALSGLGFPYTEQLAHNAEALRAGVRTGNSNALDTVRSVRDTGDYPQTRWPLLDSDWIRRPTGSVELPAVSAYATAQEVWPSHFVDGHRSGTAIQENPLTSALTDPAIFAQRAALLNSSRPPGLLFGNAIDVAVALSPLDSPAPPLDWDLDADPGIGMPTWVLPSPGAPRGSAVVEP
jgi:hypothetical protein